MISLSSLIQESVSEKVRILEHIKQKLNEGSFVSYILKKDGQDICKTKFMIYDIKLTKNGEPRRDFMEMKISVEELVGINNPKTTSFDMLEYLMTLLDFIRYCGINEIIIRADKNSKYCKTIRHYISLEDKFYWEVTG